MKAIRSFDYLQFFAMLALVAIGALAIYSSGHARVEAVFHDSYLSHLTAAAVGLVVYFVLAAGDYRAYFRLFAGPVYLASVVLLIAVLAFGSVVYGGRRWLWFFQPSEIAKLALLMLLASLYGTEADGRLRGFKGFALALGLVGVPCALILAEPDLGTMLTLLPASVLMLFAARVWRRYLGMALAGIFVFACALLGTVRIAEDPATPPERRAKILRCVPLKDHQLKRLKVFLFPESDLKGAGYNLRQAKISIGSGGFRGKGIGKGESNHLKYLPQSISMNDFIFCVYAEETGFVGSMTLLALFTLLILSCLRVAACATDARGRLFALGLGVVIFNHVFINIAMSIGMVPITGLPLPFISAGRTFLMVVMTGLGIVQSISIHSKE